MRPLSPKEIEKILVSWLNAGISKPGKSNTGLAKELGLDQPRVSEMRNGKRLIKTSELSTVARYIEEPIPPEVAVADGSDVVRVPLVSWVSAGGLADVAVQPEAEKYLTFADLGGGDFFALRVQGDSMDRVSPDGSVIVVNRDERELHAGKPYVFAVRGEATYKVWEPKPPRLEPFSTNPNNKPIFVEKRKTLHIVGRVRRTVLDL